MTLKGVITADARYLCGSRACWYRYRGVFDIDIGTSLIRWAVSAPAFYVYPESAVCLARCPACRMNNAESLAAADHVPKVNNRRAGIEYLTSRGILSCRPISDCNGNVGGDDVRLSLIARPSTRLSLRPNQPPSLSVCLSVWLGLPAGSRWRMPARWTGALWRHDDVTMATWRRTWLITRRRVRVLRDVYVSERFTDLHTYRLFVQLFLTIVQNDIKK